MRTIILASGSPRRRELLSMMHLDFTVVPSDFAEWLDDATDPSEMAITLGLGKAKEVAKRFPEAIVIGSDTIVTVGGTQLGKAANVAEARAMLRLCTGEPNVVTTSVAVVCVAENYEYTHFDNTTVYFKPYNEAAVEAYLATEDYKDKAGAWGIQSGAGPLIDHFEGDVETVIGLPTRLLVEPLAQLGVVATPAEYHL